MSIDRRRLAHASATPAPEPAVCRKARVRVDMRDASRMCRLFSSRIHRSVGVSKLSRRDVEGASNVSVRAGRVYLERLRVRSAECNWYAGKSGVEFFLTAPR